MFHTGDTISSVRRANTDTINRVAGPESEQLYKIRQTFSVLSILSFQQGHPSFVLSIENIDFSVHEVLHASTPTKNAMGLSLGLDQEAHSSSVGIVENS